MSIPPRFLDEIRSRLTLSDIIGKRVRLTRAGREFKGCCPFHKEKTPSFTVNDDKQFYHCFGCAAHGDVIGFIMQHDNLSFIDAVETLAAQAGLQMPKPSKEEIRKAEKARDLYTLMDTAAKWMQEQLYESGNRDVLEYLQGRGFTPQTLETFRIGYVPEDRQTLRSFLKSEGFEDEAMIKAGIIKKSDRGDAPYAFFRDRVMFPVADRRGRVVAFGGRVLPDHMRPPQPGSDYKPAKYINSSDTPLFDKGRTLYGEVFARQAAREDKPVIVTEGYMDVMACHQAGFTGAVAPMGTALTEEQIILLWSMIPAEEKMPILCFDGDNAGRQAAWRACERVMPLLKPGCSVRFAFLPEGEDPDSLIKAGGASAFGKVLDGAISLLDFIWISHTAGRDLENAPELRAGVIKAMQNQIKSIADRDVQTHYQEALSARISENFFRKRNKPNFTPKIDAMRPRRPVFKDIQARILVAAVLNHPHIYEEVEESFSALAIAHKGLDRVRQAVIKTLNPGQSLDRKGLQHHLNDLGLAQEMDDILSESVYVHAAFARPGAKPENVAAQWLEVWRFLQGQSLKQEVRAGWKNAFHTSSQEEEERLRHMAGAKMSE